MTLILSSDWVNISGVCHYHLMLDFVYLRKQSNDFQHSVWKETPPLTPWSESVYDFDCQIYFLQTQTKCYVPLTGSNAVVSNIAPYVISVIDSLVLVQMHRRLTVFLTVKSSVVFETVCKGADAAVKYLKQHSCPMRYPAKKICQFMLEKTYADN